MGGRYDTATVSANIDSFPRPQPNGHSRGRERLIPNARTYARKQPHSRNGTLEACRAHALIDNLVIRALFDQSCPLMAGLLGLYSLCMPPTKYLSQHDEILKTLQLYIDGSKQGKSELMRPAFHPQASFFGYAGDQLAVGTEFLFDWIDRNGPAPGIEPRVMSVDILESIDVVRLERVQQDEMQEMSERVVSYVEPFAAAPGYRRQSWHGVSEPTIWVAGTHVSRRHGHRIQNGRWIKFEFACRSGHWSVSLGGCWGCSADNTLDELREILSRPRQPRPAPELLIP
jgi:hypothetical protein